ncbi:2-hydroxychromene-2-carboxylate isomerase [Thalassovita gelatinovora]|uniref:2-hydroxychromene-2-carboxylate isomerase n=1 Tax=Thalassovita gelatinovora TaxID=53501 RepID=A0A0P1F8I2_THAGE|nr:2-hydroxychromene-2-carboxylate isomerase [Thalassovita gelatinovora]QIZ81364.1 2-hydroxychromene-2-carboxylate isomerase [Thalassovita gelatinovora]CUH64441.1 2-hydroxychromene-2-carboxylate isomerase [Thalassovita gelatinovora]SEP98676.1 2-hydroxychromene-2-carboxylate isomerase [Thalassovita gelatinovora]
MAHIDYYFSTLSPYAYLVGDRLDEIAKRHAVSITYKPFDIISGFTRTGGVPVPERHPSRVDYRAQELPRQARKLGIKLNMKPAHWPTNAAPSSYAIIAAQNAGGGDLAALVDALHAACWAEEKNIAEDAVIKDCLQRAGFDPALADRGLLAGAETYASNLEQAVADGVFGSPFFIVDSGQKFWGQDRLDDLDAHLAGDL